MNYLVEVTDTFGGEANYAWVKRFKVNAATPRGAIVKVSKETGFTFRKDWDSGDTVGYKGDCVAAFVSDHYADLDLTYTLKSL